MLSDQQAAELEKARRYTAKNGYSVIEGLVKIMDHLVAREAALYAACAEFVRKCDAGEARSTRSYAQMKDAMTMGGQDLPEHAKDAPKVFSLYETEQMIASAVAEERAAR